MTEKELHEFLKSLDFNNIKSYAEQKNISIRSLVADIGRTQTGFYQAIKKGTLRASDLFAIGKILDVSVYNLVGLDPPDSDLTVLDNSNQITKVEVDRMMDLHHDTLIMLRHIVQELDKPRKLEKQTTD